MNNKQHFLESGYRAFKNVVHADELEYFRTLFDDFMNGKYDLNGQQDLSGEKPKGKKASKITNIHKPSLLVPELITSKTYQKVIKIARELMGDDMELDFDTMVNKLPGTAVTGPWLQDASLWPELTDKRAISFSIALDDIDKENGCMMYLHGSHQIPLSNIQVTPKDDTESGILTDGKEDIVYGEIPSGSAIAHHGNTLYASLGNTSKKRKCRMLLLNLRPKSMIQGKQ